MICSELLFHPLFKFTADSPPKREEWYLTFYPPFISIQCGLLVWSGFLFMETNCEKNDRSFIFKPFASDPKIVTLFYLKPLSGISQAIKCNYIFSGTALQWDVFITSGNWDIIWIAYYTATGCGGAVVKEHTHLYMWERSCAFILGNEGH